MTPYEHLANYKFIPCNNPSGKKQGDWPFLQRDPSSGDFNGHCQHWWPEGDSNNEGTAIYDLTSDLGLSQLISEATNFQDNSAPSYIDLTVCDQPNLVTQSGTHHSLDPLCKHQLNYCKINYPFLLIT